MSDKNASPLPCFTIIAISAIGIPLFDSSPDWVIVVLSAAIILWQGYVTLRYFVMKIVAGNLLTRIPNHRKFSRVIIGAVLGTISAVIHIAEPSKSFSVIKTFSIEILFMVLAIFSLIEVFRYTEIRENGILNETGVFYHWKDIESLDWMGANDKLSVKLRNSFMRNNSQIAVSSSYRKEITDSFAQYKRNNYVGRSE